MKKKILLGLASVAVVIAGVALTSAFEAHIINVTAHIENGLEVSTKALDFGTVFPQEWLDNQVFAVALSESFLAQNRVCEVNYEINQKTKCICVDDPENPEDCPFGQYAPVDYATDLCPVEQDVYEYVPMINLCPYLSKISDKDEKDENDTDAPSYFVPAGDDPAHCIEPNEASGKLVLVQDPKDQWTIDLKVPPFAEYVAQDWPADCPVLEGTGVSADGTDLGCDLWIEVTGFKDCPVAFTTQ